MRPPLIIGHRGASAIAPENTLAAFQLTLDCGADGIEFDVRLSSDNFPVIIHDNNLKRTGSSTRQVSALTLNELKRIDVGSWFNQKNRSIATNFGGEKIPILEEVFELFETTKSLLYLEMKSDDSSGRDRLVRVCFEALQKTKVKDRVIVECFDLHGIKTIKKLDPRIKTAALFEPGITTPPSLPVSRKLVSRAVASGADEIALHHRLAHERVVKGAIDAGLKVVVWTVDDPSWIGRAASEGISALISNDPGLLVRNLKHLD